ncbi:ATP-binding protein [Nocardioides sp.]|uniref:ATP-binding protein n=1 Tax=Nocardioides sp. TaxID=35761 RepID=UPI00262F4B54|nr:ATP-binding protein [Nocardioides sp.]
MTALGTSAVLEHHPRSVGLARGLVADLVADLPVDTAADAVLLTSELVTNAVCHGGPTIELSASLSEDGVTVAVYDDGADLPIMSEARPSLEAVSGRGLQMVQQVAREWGVRFDRSRAGKTVWFELGRARWS